MKYEVIGTYPHSKFCLGDIIVSIELGGFYFDKKDPYIWRSTDIVFSNYPEIFKPIEDKPKWIDYTINFLSQSEEGTKQIPIKPRRHDLYTKDDIADFTACYISTKFPIPLDRFDKEDFNIIFDDWLDKKLKS